MTYSVTTTYLKLAILLLAAVCLQVVYNRRYIDIKSQDRIKNTVSTARPSVAPSWSPSLNPTAAPPKKKTLTKQEKIRRAEARARAKKQKHKLQKNEQLAAIKKRQEEKREERNRVKNVQDQLKRESTFGRTTLERKEIEKTAEMRRKSGTVSISSGELNDKDDDEDITATTPLSIPQRKVPNDKGVFVVTALRSNRD